MMHKCHFISVSFFWFCPEPSQRSESHGLRKMKAAALVHVTLPMFLFLFHWSETPDFSEPKNRPLWTLTQRLTLTFLLSLYRLFSYFFSGGLFIARSYVPDKVPRLPSFRVVCLCEREREKLETFIVYLLL